MEARIRADHPSGKLHGYKVCDSSNVRYVGWQDGNMYVLFNTGAYLYKGVSVQRAVACALAHSVGGYLHKRIKPAYQAVKLA